VCVCVCVNMLARALEPLAHDTHRPGVRGRERKGMGSGFSRSHTILIVQVCGRACVRACVRVRVRACVRVCVRVRT
jgi:hypothetical protein